MEFRDYFQSYSNYFWQWEENAGVAAIPGGATIAYRDFVLGMLESLAPQGIPSFGCLLLAIIATNPNGDKMLDELYSRERIKVDGADQETLDAAYAVLKLLAAVPAQYRMGRQRALLFQAFFERTHLALSSVTARKIAEFTADEAEVRHICTPAVLTRSVFTADFKPLSLLRKRFGSVEDILRKMAPLPEVAGLSVTDSEAGDGPGDFIEELAQHPRTFQIGRLVKRIWSGLNIPVHSTEPSEQPIGGVSDLTNKGQYDKLLISEFANDDLLFLSRLANNEALYMNREIPPAHNRLQRIILIDVSLKNWGTPKTIAYATMLAIAKHPKTDISCVAYAVGDNCIPLAFDSVQEVIGSFQQLDSSLHAAGGLSAFFTKFPETKNREVFLITEPSAQSHPAALRVMTEYRDRIHYWIHTDADGNIDVYKRQQSSRKHLQHLQLPLKALWGEAKDLLNLRTSKRTRQLSLTGFPILFKQAQNIKATLLTEEGDIFQVTKDKTLLRFYNKSQQNNNKGWELMADNLPGADGRMQIGRAKNGDMVLLIFEPGTKQMHLLNLATGDNKNILFNNWASWNNKDCIFRDGAFHYSVQNSTVVIDPLTGNVREHLLSTVTEAPGLSSRLRELERRFSGPANILKNINDVYISDAGKLVVNRHTLNLWTGKHLRLEVTHMVSRKAEAKAGGSREFVFADGSMVKFHRAGMMTLVSSNSNIAPVYVPLVLDTSLGVATHDTFAGSEYFFKDTRWALTLVSTGPNVLQAVRLVKEVSGFGLMQCKELTENTPAFLGEITGQDKAGSIERRFQEIGARVEAKLGDNCVSEEQEKMPVAEFYTRFIEPYILNILTNGTEH